MTTPGRRVYEVPHGGLSLREGDYGKDPRDGKWYARPPGARMGCLAGHDVTEHDDRTITVSPSILITYVNYDGQEVQWHGYLERGIWRTV